jgi:hypothetical protein
MYCVPLCMEFPRMTCGTVYFCQCPEEQRREDERVQNSSKQAAKASP